MNIRIYNVKILTMVESQSLFTGEVWIKGDTIAYVGPAAAENEEKWDREIDGEGNLLMPGFKNAHTHSAMVFLRSYVDDMKLDEWLNKQVYPAEAKLTEEDIYWQNQLAIMEYLTSGTTAAFDMYLSKPAAKRAVENTGFRFVICESINNFGGTLEEVEEDYHRYNQDESRLLSYQLGFHGEYTTSRELMEGLAALSEKYKAPVYVHCAETKREVEDCRQRTGMPPLKYMNTLKLFEYGGGLFHGVYLEGEEPDIAKEKGIYIVTNPASNLKLASGIAPVKRYLDMGIPVAIGTDGAASNNCLDMFREMFLATGLQKVLCDDPEAVPAMDVLKMATVIGARAMGLPECDSLAEGRKADMILIDLKQPNMQPEQNIEKNLIYSGSKQNVKMTMVGGKILYQDGEFFLGSSKEEIFAKANESSRRILG